MSLLKRDTPQPQIFSDEQTFSDEQIRAKAYSLWEARGGPGASSDDWQKAIEVLKQETGSKKLNGIRKGLSWVNQPLIWVEKKVIEPTADWCDRSDIFRIIGKVSPLLEAFGVILIPVAIWWFTQTDTQQKENRERQKRAQESVKTYLNQLTTVYLDGDLTKSDGLRRVTRASTLALLSDPDLDESRKGQTIQYLIELELVQAKTIKEQKQGKQKEKVFPPLISLSGADLSGAYLSFVNLNFANLSGANLSRAYLNLTNLGRANLSRANLSRANLGRANLSRANLRGSYLGGSYLSGANLSRANLSGANLSRADLSGANLSGANLSGAYLRGANLGRANLSGANLSRADLGDTVVLTDILLQDAKLCKTKLSKSRKLNPDRDCKELRIQK